MNIKEKFWIGTFITLWVLVSTVSTIHSVEFFSLSNNLLLSWCLAIAFEIGAMASLGGILISKGNKTLIWWLFIVLTLFQVHGNMYWAWVQSGDISEWTKLFALTGENADLRRRVFAFISGGILPLVSLGFIKSLMDYLKPVKDDVVSDTTNDIVGENKYEVTDKDIAEGDYTPEDRETLHYAINNTTSEKTPLRPLDERNALVKFDKLDLTNVNYGVSEDKDESVIEQLESEVLAEESVETEIDKELYNFVEKISDGDLVATPNINELEETGYNFNNGSDLIDAMDEDVLGVVGETKVSNNKEDSVIDKSKPNKYNKLKDVFEKSEKSISDIAKK